MKKFIVFFVVMILTQFTSVFGEEVADPDLRPNTIVEIRQFVTEAGENRILIKYCCKDMNGAFTLWRAVDPAGTYMPAIRGTELVADYFEGWDYLIFILDADTTGHQRTYRIQITP